MKWKIAIACLVIVGLGWYNLVQAEGKGKDKESKGSKSNASDEVKQDKETGPDHISPGSSHGKGDNRDDEHSGKVDLIGDGNSGQKGKGKKGKPTYKLKNRKCITYRTQRQHYEFVGKNDPSVIKADIALEPINYLAEKGIYQLSIKFQNIKINYWDDNIAFTYRFTNPKHQQDAFNELYLALTLPEQTAPDAGDLSLAARALNYEELLLAVGYVILCDISFVVEVSEAGGKISFVLNDAAQEKMNINKANDKALDNALNGMTTSQRQNQLRKRLKVNMMNIDKALDSALNGMPAGKRQNLLRKLLKADILKRLEMIFPSLTSGKYQRVSSPGMSIGKIKYSRWDKQKSKRSSKREKQSFIYNPRAYLIMEHTWTDDSTRVGINQVGIAGYKYQIKIVER